MTAARTRNKALLMVHILRTATNHCTLRTKHLLPSANDSTTDTARNISLGYRLLLVPLRHQPIIGCNANDVIRKRPMEKWSVPVTQKTRPNIFSEVSFFDHVSLTNTCHIYALVTWLGAGWSRSVVIGWDTKNQDDVIVVVFSSLVLRFPVRVGFSLYLPFFPILNQAQCCKVRDFYAKRPDRL